MTRRACAWCGCIVPMKPGQRFHNRACAVQARNAMLPETERRRRTRRAVAARVAAVQHRRIARWVARVATEPVAVLEACYSKGYAAGYTAGRRAGEALAQRWMRRKEAEWCQVDGV